MFILKLDRTNNNDLEFLIELLLIRNMYGSFVSTLSYISLLQITHASTSDNKTFG